MKIFDKNSLLPFFNIIGFPFSSFNIIFHIFGFFLVCICLANRVFAFVEFFQYGFHFFCDVDFLFSSSSLVSLLLLFKILKLFIFRGFGGRSFKYVTNIFVSDFPWYKDLKKTLNDVFKLKDFRPYQLPTINATLSKQDVLLIMPTGGGKSLCYQLPALIDKGNFCFEIIFS